MMMHEYTCRCCLLENPTHTYNIFDGNLRCQLQQCSPNVNIEPDDGLPEVICDRCWLHVRESIEFRRRCEVADQELRKRYDDTNKAIEEALKSGIFDDIDEVDGLIEKLTEESTTPTSTYREEELLDDTQNISELEIALLSDLLLEDDNLSEVLDSNPTSENNSRLDGIVHNEVNDSTFVADKEISEIPIPEKCTTSCDSYTNIQRREDDVNTIVDVGTTAGRVKAKTPLKSPKSLHPCSECEKKFTRNFQLKLHMISVHNIGNGLQYKCQNCDKTFASRHSLSYHYKSLHSAERPFACTHCQRRFVLRTQLASHERIHTGESKPRIHECEECGKCWPTKSDLRTHMRSHDPDVDRPFKCDRCDKSFFTRGHLVSHVFVHTGEKPFACSFCEKSYQSVGNLNNHLVRHHSSDMVGKLNSVSTTEETLEL